MGLGHSCHKDNYYFLLYEIWHNSVYGNRWASNSGTNIENTSLSIKHKSNAI